MSIESNKQLAAQFFERFSANDIRGALDTMSEDATWWIAGKKDQLPAAGLYGKEKIARLFYRQEYHPLITVRDGKIAAVREYLDTQHVFATWFAA